MWPLLRAELRKLWRRRETALLLGTFLVLPLFLSYSMGRRPDTVTVQGQYDLATLYDVTLGLFGSLMFSYLAVVLVAASALARESDDGSLKMLLLRSPGRLALWHAKCAGVFVFALSLLVAVFVGTAVGFFAFVASGPHAAAAPVPGAMGQVVRQVILQLLGLCTWGGVVLVLGLRAGFGGSIGGGIGLLVISKVMERWDAVQRYVPTFLADAGHFLGPDGKATELTPYIWLPLYAGAVVAVGAMLFRRMDVRA